MFEIRRTRGFFLRVWACMVLYYWFGILYRLQMHGMIYCRTAKFRVQEIFAYFTKLGRFTKISCTRILHEQSIGLNLSGFFLQSESTVGKLLTYKSWPIGHRLRSNIWLLQRNPEEILGSALWKFSAKNCLWVTFAKISCSTVLIFCRRFHYSSLMVCVVHDQAVYLIMNLR